MTAADSSLSEAAVAGPVGSAGGPEVRHVVLHDGRRLAFACLGAPLATAKLKCIYYHGVPASLVEAEPLAAAAAPLGIAIVVFDRPGMGGSSPHPAMSVRSVVADAAALMSELGLAAAVQVGESGGAPYAAAFAALHPERTQQLLLLAGLGPTHGREHARLRRALNSMDRLSMHGKKLGFPWTINSFVKMAADHIPRVVKAGAGGSLGPADARYLRGNSAAKDWLLRFMQRAYQHGVRGVLADYRVLGHDWRVDLQAVRCRTALWHGSADKIVPPSHSAWFHTTIPGSELTVVEGEGHISLVGRHAQAILADALAAAGLADATPAAAAAAGAAGLDSVDSSMLSKDSLQSGQEPSGAVDVEAIVLG
ncbi:hypothetical protein ABPG75_001838 [Micractinium tetrahymenae]